METQVTSEVIKALEDAARRAHPREACGLLLGEEAVVTHFRETHNVHPSPTTHFEIDPQVLIAAHRAAREGGPQVLGYFHSHPKGPAKPSKTDQQSAAGDGMLWAIWGEDEVSFWRDQPEGFHEVSYFCADG